MRGFVRITIIVVLLAVGGLTLRAALRTSPAAGKKVLVLGCDGMDPKLVRRLIDDGRLPHFAKLEQQGGFKPLTTSIPPQSPVAWSNFITGAGPGVHGIFDFIHRKLAPSKPWEHIEPYFSTNWIVTTEEAEPWKVGDYCIPRSEVSNELLRRGTPFWEHLDARGIPVQLYRMPANYPPSPSSHGHMCCLSGMGVPDALGTQGTYQHFTTRARANREVGGGIQTRLKKNFKTGAYIARLEGPPNDHKPPRKGQTDPPEMMIELNIHRDPDNEVVKIVYENRKPTWEPDETVEIVLNASEWSGWHEARFLKTPLGPTLATMVRFYVQRVHPDIDLYVTPLNFIPTEPAAVFSEPADFVEEIGSDIGNFYTQGFAEDFKARDTGVMTDAEYKVQADMVLDERFKMLDRALKNFEEGMLFFYFSSSDLQAHLFFWEGDEPHPIRSPSEAKKYMGVVEDVYVRMDEALGKCMDALGDDATILVMSDHGFCNFSRGFNLNTWLKREGYLAADKGVLEAIDVNDPTHGHWSKTRAYGMGLNGLYVNLKGRERFGIVSEAERVALLDEISEKLLAFRDPKNGRQVIKRVYRREEWYKGPEMVNAPDLIIGYDRDYRASWNTCLGDFDADVMVDNNKAWSADHCIAHDVVPGIVLSNKTIVADEPALIDVAPTVLAEFGVAKPGYMTGNSFYAK